MLVIAIKTKIQAHWTHLIPAQSLPQVSQQMILKGLTACWIALMQKNDPSKSHAISIDVQNPDHTNLD
jgi:hypothetical protein